MQPACQHLPVTPGTTYRPVFRLMQPAFAYRPITGISGSPVQLTVPAHGLVDTWPVWVRGVRGMPALNSEPVRQRPHRATVIDANTLEINALSAEGLNAAGGELIYKLPVDLTGCEVRMQFTRDGSELLSLTLGAGLANPAPGSITGELTPAQTAQLTGDWHYTLDVQFSDGAVQRYAQGGQLQRGACHA